MRHPLLEPRDERHPPAALRGLGLLVDTDAGAEDVVRAFADVAAPGWERTSATAAVHGWMQRDLNLWPMIALQSLNDGWPDPMSRTQSNGGGWLVARVSGVDGSGGARIDVRGEADAPLEERLEEALDALGARLLRRWDPTAGLVAPRRTPIPPTMRPRPRTLRS